jgi:transcription termination/antitermination protein NusA
MEGILTQIEALSKAKGIDPDIVVQAIKDAILVAARKFYKTNEDLIAEFRTADGHVDVYAVKTITDVVSNPGREISLAEARQTDAAAEVGGEVRFPKPTDGLGRISAQLAKQVIFQKIREAERDTICSEFSGRVGHLETCTVKRSEGPDLIVDLGRTEGRLPRREQSKLESFSPGDRIRVVIKMIEKAGRGPAVVVSRASEDLVRRLFEQEVPEIYDSTVEIRACAREAGERTKIAVLSHDRDVDAVGACVGMKGMRVQSIIRELRGEKIDIIEYSDDAIEMATRALSPAKISRVTILDGSDRHLEVVVDDMQLSLAIGKKGQNVRLAAKLMGWRIDIKSEEEKRQEVETAMAAMVGPGTPVSILIDHGLADKLADKLLESDVTTVERLADMTPEQLEEIPGIGPKMVEKIQVAVNSYYLQFEQPQDAAAAEEVVPLDDVAADAAGGETPQAVPAIMPGLPVAGEDVEDVEDNETPIGEEDFDNMDLSAPDEGEETAEVAADGSGRPETGSAAAAGVRETASGTASPAAAGEQPVAEDEEMTS